MQISSPAQFKAMGHPLRQRLLFALGEPATISQLAQRLSSAKGNISHHLKVLRDAGLVRSAYTRQVRGGTEQYFQRAAARLDIAPRAAEPTAAMLGAVAQEIATAADEPLLVLRHVRLSAAQALRLRDTLYALSHELDNDAASGSRYGMVVGLWQESSFAEPGESAAGGPAK
jgi:DNA-binding transcriptional ArsR family regulator